MERNDGARCKENSSIGVEVEKHDRAQWRCKSVLKKYREVMEPGKEAEFYATHKPYEVIEMEGNALLAAGITLMWALIVGGGGTAYNHLNSVLQVYTGVAYVAGTLDAGSPTTITGGKEWIATWTGAVGDGVWSKWQVTNGTQGMNEKTEAMGTKSGGTWTLTVDITLS